MGRTYSSGHRNSRYHTDPCGPNRETNPCPRGCLIEGEELTLRHPPGRHLRAFTLLELLVVITILAMLVGFLLPSLQGARIQARDTLCRSHLRTLYLAHVEYVHTEGRFPVLNNEPDDGSWQYNYLIYDGRDFESNFGPLLDDGSLDSVESLYCPRQKDPYHSLSTPENPWPIIPLLDTRAAYGRRYHLSGKGLARMKRNPAILADVFHIPKVIKSAHRTGVNVAYLDGHVKWVFGRDILMDNELTHPFQREDNDIIEDIWDELNRGGR